MSDSSEVYYVVLRGAGRQPLFEDDADRRHFTGVIAEAASARRVIVHAYCWLEAEARLALQPAGVAISQFAQFIADRHTRCLRRRISLTGSHFEQMYRGVLVDSDTELPQLVRHIHLAPLKAGLAHELAEYPWSSHRAYLGAESAPWVTLETTLAHFALPGADPRVGYLEFMENGAKAIGMLATAEPRPEESGRPVEDSLKK